MSQPFQRKEDYEVDNDENNRNIDDSRYENDNFVKKLGQGTIV